jgi:hypothetical protein
MYLGCSRPWVQSSVLKKKKEKEGQCTTQTRVLAHLLTAAMNVLTSGVFVVEKHAGVWLKFTLR